MNDRNIGNRHILMGISIFQLIAGLSFWVARWIASLNNVSSNLFEVVLGCCITVVLTALMLEWVNR